MIKVACLYYEICGTATYFVDEAEYEVYGDDWACAECLDTVAEFAVNNGLAKGKYVKTL